LRGLLERDPEAAEGWALRAELARQEGLEAEEVAARCRHLELTGEEVSPELRERWGLVRRIATHNDLTCDLTRLGEVVYAGTRGGWLYGIDARSLEVAVKKEFPAAFAALSGSGQLKAYFADRQSRNVAEHLDESPLLPAKPPPESISGYDGPLVRWKGKLYRPLGGGTVRVLDGATVTEHKTSLPRIQQWQIHISPAGPLGYGSGGVYALDERLCPARKLIGGEGDAGREFHVFFLASDSRTLGLHAWNGKAHVLQVWTRDGSRKLREQEILPPGSVRGHTGRLVALNGGYLLAAGEVVWVPASPDGPVWRFGFGERPGTSLPKIRFAHTPLFGRPLVRDNLLFVGCRDGAIYVFDVGALTRPGRR
jgi:hypothetical protein